MARKLIALFLSLFILIPAGCAGLPLSTSEEVEISFSSGLVPLSGGGGSSGGGSGSGSGSISTSLPTSYGFTATVNPAGTALDWAVEWVNPAASWAIGKSASSYVRVAPRSDGSNYATVSMLKEFGAQIKIVVSARTVPDKKAECLVDCAQRLTASGLSFYGMTSDAMTDELLFEIPLAAGSEAVLTPVTPAGYDDNFCRMDLAAESSSVYTLSSAGANPLVEVLMTWNPQFFEIVLETWGVELPPLEIVIGSDDFNIHKNAILGTLGGNILNMIMTDESRMFEMVGWLEEMPVYLFIVTLSNDYITCTDEHPVWLDYKALM